MMLKGGRQGQPANWTTSSLRLVLLFFLLLATSLYCMQFDMSDYDYAFTTSTSSPTTDCDPNILYRGPEGLPPLKNRKQLGGLLEARKLQHGAEVGVQQGQHAKELLSHWTSCQSFFLIDLWAQQVNYKDVANVENDQQEQLFQTAQKRLAGFADKTKFFRMLSTQAAQEISDHSLDFVYIDARHDYCGVLEDLRAYYGKLRPGGIMAGHDYMTTKEVQTHTPEQDWSVCMDGSVHPTAVKGAVLEFAQEHGLVVSVMYGEDARFPSWVIQKPTRPECITVVPEDSRFASDALMAE